MKKIIKDHVPSKYKFLLLILTMTLMITSRADAEQGASASQQAADWGNSVPPPFYYQVQRKPDEATYNYTGDIDANRVGSIGYANGVKPENAARRGYSGYVMVKLRKCSNEQQLAHKDVKLTQPEGYKDAFILGADNQRHNFNTSIPAYAICGVGDSYLLFKPYNSKEKE